MAVDPRNVCLFIGPGLRKFKLDLFERIGRHIVSLGGKVIRHDFAAVAALPDETIPIIGGSPELRETFTGWLARGRQFITWDRGYARRVFATWNPRGENGGFYRWTCNAWQMRRLRDVPADRWEALKTPISPWSKNGQHIVIACPSPTYERVHGISGWTENTVRELSLLTKRQLVVRDKESKRPLQDDLRGAHCLVTHGSMAGVEAVMMGCPVFVHPDSAASLVGQTDIRKIETPIYPDRQPWLNSLAYSQYNENELINGTLWRLLG